ncbi:NAD+ synthase [Tistrella bauzanensis]|uniref:Glutamine-dependent NAD(+) synthetase n=1 Tax=Tistrella bauzanensis TaxID=657419 RepID=A0ABQ1IRB9_9PROT|nr:NAD+ synthase [Tistrella bauzanensis]GGB49173.1 NAD+ synthase [Tistrella bauzanensis]
MTQLLTLALAQINPVVGDVDGNAERLLEARRVAAEQGADICVAGELALVGYPPEDLVRKPAFMRAVRQNLDRLAAVTTDGGPAMVVGAPLADDDGRLYNAAFVLDDGRITGVVRKHALPNYGVFDEVRVFDLAPPAGPVMIRGWRVGLMVCEDMWRADSAECLAESGAEFLLVINGSPYEVDKRDQRLAHAVARIHETGLPLAYVNLVGGQDELVFDGASFMLDRDGSLKVQAPAWVSGSILARIRRSEAGEVCAEAGEISPEPEVLEAIYAAMTLGLADYVNKNGFPGVVLGLSGGIDSALSLAVAVDALGPDRVRTVMMPSRYTSRDSLDDAAECARLTGVRLDEIPIEPAVQAFSTMLAPVFGDRGPDVTEENIQSRIRGVTLMALSNKFGDMVLTTGNKSEMSVGYATLYGDMCGGYSVLKDVYKLTVFELSRWRNGNRPEGALGPDGPVMPERVISKPPSAELREDQKDEDSLPPYERLDAILEGLVEKELPHRVLVEQGFDRDEVDRIARLLYVAEYKRRQAPPGVKITPRAFGRDRRYPITNQFRDRA